ncbi:ABC transporter permease [Nocardioides lianchengensis]|uniref:Peptide/nickel transport system permease protein n=1 Tax=Nocardioides lianchengensis TaxID=1045774 RepID=A0A1G6YG17_9ACTN|nr:ABC transporter permease [Nocardioides lianchengensis]NYG09687.1 peptide/nickel transport system permease protein [Nocardioides lianchengensis]SDD88496.1 peptide/nickel transport system permease protein [Nocardioides lianchengensis]
MSLPPVSSETLGHLSDEAPQAPEAGKGKGPVKSQSPLQIAFGRLRRDKVAVACAVIVLFFVLIAIFAGVIANAVGVETGPGSPATELDYLGDGMPLNGPPHYGFDPNHPFGISPSTAEDNLAQWLYGCRTSLTVAALSTIVASLIGVTMGLLAGFLGGIADRIISFVTDLFLTLPYILIALIIAPILNERFALKPDIYPQAQLWSLVAILAGFGWMSVARLVRGEVLSLREREFILSAEVIGMPTRRIMLRELLPNLVAPIVVAVSLMLPAFIAAEAALAYLGIGITQGESWGQTISQATKYFKTYPLYLWEPLIGIVVLVVALNLLGDAIRDAVDPKTRR